MTRDIVVGGERFVALDTLAERCTVEIEWARAVYEHGLLGRGETRERTLFVSVRMVERLVVIRRFQVQTGVDLDLLGALLDLPEEP
jgi:hypothetical protein